MGISDPGQILVVDDVQHNRTLLRQLLEEEGYSVSEAADGLAAIATAQGQPQPDLILLDVMMPGLSGWETCRRLKQEPATSRIPVIFVTSRNEEAEEEQGFAAGAVDYIAKPIRIPIVRARVRTHLLIKKQHDLITRLLKECTSELAQSEQEYMRLFVERG